MHCNTMRYFFALFLVVISAVNTRSPLALPYDDRPCYDAATTPSAELLGLCRPSFLIIGAGKAGTSSLYSYLQRHPKVLPARVKQTHFWKYDYSGRASIPGYYRNFPNATAFGGKGEGHVTGEASPGYLPSSESAERTGKYLKGVKIIVMIRDPVERAFSSYKYNYVNAILGDIRARGVMSRRRKRERAAEVGIDGHMEAINAEEVRVGGSMDTMM